MLSLFHGCGLVPWRFNPFPIPWYIWKERIKESWASVASLEDILNGGEPKNRQMCDDQKRISEFERRSRSSQLGGPFGIMDKRM